MSNLFLSGVPPYLGTKANKPPNAYVYHRRPTVSDINHSVNDFWIFDDPNPGSNFQELWFLSSLKGDGSIPGSMAKWVLLSDTGGGVLQVTTDDAVQIQPLLGNINLLGSTNITTTGDIPTGTARVFLKDSILLPATTDADHGVIALGVDLTNDRFMHNYSLIGAPGLNTFIGRGSGNFTLLDTHNTGIGGNTLLSLTTGRNNIAIGPNTMRDVDDGQDNIGIGEAVFSSLSSGNNNIGIGNNLTGSQYTLGEDSNILINNAGVGGDQNKIRIGTQGNNPFEQDNTFIAGITGVTTALANVTPTTVVNVGTDGELGETLLYSSDLSINIAQTISGGLNAIDFTSAGGGGGGEANPFSFSYVQVTDTGNVGSGVTYNLGSQIVLTQLFDVGNNVFPGDGLGAPAVFTAPVTGKYYLEWYVGTDNFLSNTITINTTARNYAQINQSSASGPVFNLYTVVTDMNMGDTATFDVTFTVVGANPTRVRGNAGATLLNSTRISGFLIPEGGTGGNFSQPFLGIQQVDTVAVPGNTITMGANAIVTQQYDVGANFDPGNGVGTAASFTVPVTGIYQFNIAAFASVSWAGSPGKRFLQILVNGVMQLESYDNGQTGDLPLQLTGSLSLSAVLPDVVTFVITTGGSTSITLRAAPAGSPASNNITFISGYRIA